MLNDKCVHITEAQLLSDSKTPTVTFQNGSSDCEPNVALAFTPKNIVTCTDCDETSVAKQCASDKVFRGAEIKDVRRNSTDNLKKDRETQYHPVRRSSSCNSFYSKK